MRLSSLVLGIIMGTVLFLALPYFLIQANTIFNLPVVYHPLLQPAGVILMAIGGILFAYCSGLFAISGKGTPVPIDPPQELVTGGIYKYTRNPMYLSYLMIFLGEFLFLGHVALLIYFFGMTAFIVIFVIRYEEPELKKRFGQKYVEYTNKVPRFF